MFSRFRAQAQVNHVGGIKPAPDWRMKPHNHSFHEVICVLRGHLHVASGGRVLTGSYGDVLIYPQGVTHEEWTDADAPVESLFVTFSCPPDDAATAVVAAHDPRGRILDMVRWIHEDAVAGHTIPQPEHQGLLYAILAELDRALTTSSRAWTDQVRRHIQEHLAETLSLDALARVAELSRYHFVRAYKQATGVTPMADVRAMRVQHARQLILGTSLPLKEVAKMSGLGNAYSLSRTFRRCLDIPPGKLRRFHRG